jgi:hypothetical protein
VAEVTCVEGWVDNMLTGRSVYKIRVCRGESFFLGGGGHSDEGLSVSETDSSSQNTERRMNSALKT